MRLRTNSAKLAIGNFCRDALPLHEPAALPNGLGVRRPSAALERRLASQSGGGPPHSRTLSRDSFHGTDGRPSLEVEAPDEPPKQLRLHSHPRAEEGSLLIIVLWISFGLVALTLYFAHSMSQELRASDNRVAALEAQQAVDGAARYLSNILATVALPGHMPAPMDFACEAVPVGEATFWLIGRDTNDWEIDLQQPFYGLVDEASKINLNAPWLTAEMIQYLPGMTPQIAAAIMDWRDANTSISTDGAEDETYSRLAQPYKTKNAPFESVEELRLVAGVTKDILYGEDANLNGILDANEDDADDAAPNDNRDSRLDPGLMEYFTVYSYEPMVGTNINNASQVNSMLQEFLGQNRAREILTELRRTGGAGGGGPQPGNNYATVGSVLEFYLRGGFSEDEFAQIADYLAPTTNILVNVNTASEAVLECIPGIGLDYAAQVVSYRDANPAKLTSVAWVAAALNDDALARQAGPYLTTRSFQYTADVAAVGHHGRGYQRVRFVFDTSEDMPLIVRRQDLTHLGWALGREARTQLLAGKEAR